MEIDVSFVKFNDVEYEILRGSDVIRDGMYLEASILRPGIRDQVLEIFYSDINGHFTISYCKDDLPMELVEYMIINAKMALPPNRGA